MKSLVVASFGVALVVAAAVAYFTLPVQALRGFCLDLAVGTPEAQVRESARDAGFAVKQEPFAQLKIELSHWHYSAPSCDVFFNPDRTLEYRTWESQAH